MGWSVFQEVAAGSGFHGAEDVCIRVIVRQDEHIRGRVECSNTSGCVRTRVRLLGTELQVHQNNVWVLAFRQHDGVIWCGRFGDDVEVRFEAEKGVQAGTDDGVIVGDDKPDHANSVRERSTARVVPCPGAALMVSVPPSCSTRSAVACNPNESVFSTLPLSGR